MMKNIQTKILLIFYIIGIAIILGIGAFFIAIINSGSPIENANIQIQQTKILILSSILVFSCIVLLVGIYVVKHIIHPMDKLIKETEKVTGKEDGKLIEVGKVSKKRRKTEVDTLTNAIGIMTIELNQKLNDVNRQKREIEAILLHMNDGVIAFDENGKIMHINPAAKELLNINNEVTFEEIFKKLDVNIKMDAIMYLDSWAQSEQRVIVGEKIVNIFFAAYKDENDFSSGIIAVIQDITEHVKLDNMRKEFVADVSHELKTPITSIMGYADTLLETDHDKVIETKFLGVISSEAKRMSKLVTDLLSLSRFDSNKTNIVKEEFDLGELAKKCQEKLQIEIDKKHLQVHCLVTANVPPVYAEKDGIERVIINILSNSIKYTNENGTINIYVGFVYNDAYIKFIDTGIGIPEEDLERIFERFYRVDKARTREMGGTGLGLSIAKEILDRNNGTIDIKSKLNEGTEVVIRIPTKTNNKFILKEEENLNEGKARQQSNIQEQKDN